MYREIFPIPRYGTLQNLIGSIFEFHLTFARKLNVACKIDVSWKMYYSRTSFGRTLHSAFTARLVVSDLYPVIFATLLEGHLPFGAKFLWIKSIGLSKKVPLSFVLPLAISWNKIWTRKHSSRMHTDFCSDIHSREYTLPPVYPTLPLDTLPRSQMPYPTPGYPSPLPPRNMGPGTWKELGTRDTLLPHPMDRQTLVIT